MVGNAGTQMTMRIVRNKVRSCDDTIVPNKMATTTTTEVAAAVAATKTADEQQQKPQSSFNRGHKHLSISFRLPKNQHFAEDAAFGIGKSRFFTNHFSKQQEKNNSSIITTAGTDNNDNNNKKVVGFTRTSGIGVMPTNTWVFPPNAPTPNIYHCLNTEELMAANDNSGFKGFRKQFSGRFKRLVAARKPEPVPVIPPHLKPQLKTIYVY